jgi:hypothetical protein
MKERSCSRTILTIIFVLLMVLGFLKMCAVSVENKVEREPLRQIDNWR